ncbi:MAG: amino acid racemase [Patescibacteria group bacterium]|nr:amino acid racemase [Patescibacteria group bacterium]MCL5095418.1 amino acid racemase [Patescibacteria group bacterium]
MKTAGIIGGFGPETTTKFQLEIVEIFRALKIKERPALLIWQTPIPVKIEQRMILQGQGISKFLPFLIDGAQKLENGGADFLVLPCNTLHILIDDLRKSINLPLINLIEETAKDLVRKKIKSIGILGSQETIKSRLHQQLLSRKGIIPILPNENEQKLINKVISQILTNKNLSETEKTLRRVVKNLEARGTKNILLACTDLQLVFPKIKGIEIHDTLSILAQATAREILKKKL